MSKLLDLSTGPAKSGIEARTVKASRVTMFKTRPMLLAIFNTPLVIGFIRPIMPSCIFCASSCCAGVNCSISSRKYLTPPRFSNSLLVTALSMYFLSATSGASIAFIFLRSSLVSLSNKGL